MRGKSVGIDIEEEEVRDEEAYVLAVGYHKCYSTTNESSIQINRHR